MCYSHLHLLALLLLSYDCIYAQLEILPDSTIWYDDHTTHSSGIRGWAYLNDSNIINGEKTIYYGWFSQELDLKYFGYFYRSFQCEYKSTLRISFDVYYGCDYGDSQNNKDWAEYYINERRYVVVPDDTKQPPTQFNDTVALNRANQCSRDSTIFHKYSISFDETTEIIPEYTPFTIGFRPSCQQDPDDEFCAFSNITLQCIKVNASDTNPNPIPIPTPSPTFPDITDPISNTNFDCFSATNDEDTCNEESLCKMEALSDGTSLCGKLYLSLHFSSVYQLVFDTKNTLKFKFNEFT